MWRLIILDKEKKRRNKIRRTLSSAQEVTYSRSFKMADRAGGFTNDTERV